MPAREIQIVSTATGLVESLTINGLQAIKEADLIVFDDTIGLAIRDLWSKRTETIRVSASVISEINDIEKDLQPVTEAIRQGKRVTRIVGDYLKSLERLNQELRLLQRWGFRHRILPNREVFEREAWVLQLPWLLSMRPSRFRIIESTSIKGDSQFWEELATTSDTLAIESGQGSLQTFVDRLLMFGADPQRPVALVSHSPTQDPMCWLTTLDELDEIFPQWKSPAATILYIGCWTRPTSADRQHDFWGPLAAAADHWRRTGMLVENN